MRYMAVSKMQRLTLILVTNLLAYVNGQAPGDDRTCTGVTNIHYHCGGESVSPGVEDGNQSGSFKGSYRGKAGPKGDKGSQGEPGTNEEIENELSLLKQEVAELRQRLDNQAIPRSCAEVNETAHRASGRYIISPNPFRVLPFSVSCDFSNVVAETIVHHDSETEITISKCEPSRCYNRKVDYQLSIDQVAALVDVSTSCRQFIKLRCLGVQPFLNRNPSIAAWVSRNATAKTYWGGVTPDEIGCACGLTGYDRNHGYHARRYGYSYSGYGYRQNHQRGSVGYCGYRPHSGYYDYKTLQRLI